MQTRAGKLWSQIEATYKQIDTARTEVECFRTLQKQEQVAGSHRVNNLIEEVNKQRELERTLQNQYGELLVEYERVQTILAEHKEKLRIQEEIAMKNRELEEQTAAKNRSFEEEIAKLNCALEEEMAVKNQTPGESGERSLDQEMVDATEENPPSRSSQADLPKPNLSETDISPEESTVQKSISQLHVENSCPKEIDAQDQAGHSVNVVPSDKEIVTANSNNASIEQAGNSSPVSVSDHHKNIPVENPIINPLADETMIVDSSIQESGTLVGKPDSISDHMEETLASLTAQVPDPSSEEQIAHDNSSHPDSVSSLDIPNNKTSDEIPISELAPVGRDTTEV